MHADKQLVVYPESKFYKYPEGLIKDAVSQKTDTFENDKLLGFLKIIEGPDMLVRFEIFDQLLSEGSDFDEPRIINVTDILR